MDRRRHCRERVGRRSRRDRNRGRAYSFRSWPAHGREGSRDRRSIEINNVLVLSHWGFGFGVWKQVFGGEFGVEDQVEKSDHHFV
jgi:hypothetical protein